MYDFHCHTTMSDGALIPTELIRRMAVAGYTEMAITDHADYSNVEFLIESQKKVKRSAERYGVKLFTGVEITHVPPEEIADFAKYRKSAWCRGGDRPRGDGHRAGGFWHKSCGSELF